MNRLHLLGAAAALVLGLGAAVAGWATEGQGFTPEGLLTIPTEEGLLLELADAYARERGEAGNLRIPATLVADRLLADLPVTVLDVRKPSEYAELHLRGARLLPLGDLLAAGGDVAIPLDGPVVTVCNKGFTAMEAMVFLRLAGIPALAMESGMKELQAELLNPAGIPTGSPFADPRYEGREADLSALLEGGGAADYEPPAAVPKRTRKRRSASVGEGC